MNCGDFGGQTVAAARRGLSDRFRAASVDTPELDARILLGMILDLDLSGLMAQADRVLTAEEATRLETSARRRLIGEPVARIRGVKEFWGLPLRLSAATLVPRPDTETVVELALELLRAGPDPARPCRIADLGTGSGAILLALLSEWQSGYGIGTDLSEDALQIAAANAGHLGLASRSAFVACDFAAALEGSFDLIVCNPPYIRSADIAGLAPEVRDHDPPLALDGGADGLEGYRRLVRQVPGLLAAGGALVVEMGQGQSADIEAMMTAAGLTLHGPPKADLAGIPRAVAGLNLPS